MTINQHKATTTNQLFPSQPWTRKQNSYASSVATAVVGAITIDGDVAMVTESLIGLLYTRTLPLSS